MTELRHAFFQVKRYASVSAYGRLVNETEECSTGSGGDRGAVGRRAGSDGSGTGKTHLLIALGTLAAEAGYRVRYTLASKLVNELVEAADDKQLTKLINRYGRVDLILVDELGYLQLDRRGAELLFQVLTEREERSAIAIASNEPFSSWTKTFTDPRLCAAIVDRLTFAGQIIETGSTSYRLAHARNIKPPPKASSAAPTGNNR